MPRNSLYHPRDLPRSGVPDDRVPLEYPLWGAVFCEILANCGNFRRACIEVGINYSVFYRFRVGDPPRVRPGRGPCVEFNHDCDLAMEQALDLLRMEAWRRAKKGSDRLLMFLMRAHDPDLYAPAHREELEVRRTGEDQDALDSIRRKLLERAQAIAGELAEHAAGDSEIIEGESIEIPEDADAPS